MNGMIILFHHSKSSLPRRYDWFESSKNLPAMVYNFVRTQDCLLDAFPRPYLDTKITLTRIGTKFHVMSMVN